LGFAVEVGHQCSLHTTPTRHLCAKSSTY
jgi:hypothetical protein